MIQLFPSSSVCVMGLLALAALSPLASSQELLQENVLDSFRPVEGWRGVAEVAAVPGKTEITSSGNGRILANGNEKDTSTAYLFTKAEYGDVRVELEFMIPKNSNAGVYLMGRYEVQIFDSHGRPRVGSGDLGGIYQRYDPTLPKDQQGFGGVSPMVNAAKAPGEWQTLEVVFRAPDFDDAGTKTSDATFEKVMVNGVVVQENATSTGPTRSAPLEGDAAQGPIVIQGDHGPIAIRSFRVTPVEEAGPARLAELDAYWAEVSRAVKAGDFEAYQASCHPEGVLVSGSKRMSQPLSAALARWKQEFVDTREGKIRASVDFRFSNRVGDATTAHESGIFRYVSEASGEPQKVEYINFEGLLVKRSDGWKLLMENQQGPASEDAWKALN